MYKRSEVEKTALDYFDDPLVANVWLDKYALKKNENEFLELSPKETIIRIAKELHRIEQTYPNPTSYEEIYSLLMDYNKFVLGGSCLFGIGNTLTLSTLGNCFVVDSPVDSYSGIFKTDQELAQLMKRRGGVGVDLSTIRPKGTKVNNAASSSTGLVTFAERFSNTTREVAQEGRRGALMLSIDITHDDAPEFIACKDDFTKVTGANISVRVPDSFMELVITGEELATKLWNKLIHQAWKNGEPGILFWDKIIKESPADCYKDFRTISTNPCSELPLCAYDSCRLSAINLFAYVKHPFTEEATFDFEALEHDAKVAQRIMDNIIDLENEKIIAIQNKIAHDPEDWDLKSVENKLWYQIQFKLLQGRRTGLGQMGLADAGAALGLKYGSNPFIEFAYDTSNAIARASYMSSIDMAKERGAFPKWDYEKEENQSFITRMYLSLSRDYQKMYETYGRRNIANLTIAPTGSISMLSKVSSGIEPVFALSYTRKRKVSADNPNKKIQDKMGDWWEEYGVLHPRYAQFLKGDNRNFPDPYMTKEAVENYFKNHPYVGSTAHEVDPYKKLKVQAVIQPWIDHSISVTYNLPKETTEKQVSDLYTEAWKLGLKGMTVYRDGSREGVLITSKSKTIFAQTDAPKRPKTLLCDIYSMTSQGKHWIVCVGLFEGKPYEVFAFNNYNLKNSNYAGELIKVSRGKYDLNIKDIALVENITKNCSDEENLLTRMISTSLRHGADMKFVVEQLLKSEGDVTSFGKAVARTLRRYVKDGELRGIICSNCGTMMVSEGGCWVCKQCGNNKCE
jgi:ribonucleoside-diphosphate reductase alpha chain